MRKPIVITFAFLLLTLVLSIQTVYSQQTMPQMPQGLAKVCIEHDHCEGAEAWLIAMSNLAEMNCSQTKVIAEKVSLTNALISYQRQVDLLDLDEPVITLNDLCAGLLNQGVTYIDVKPVDVGIDVGESVDLTATIVCSNGTCQGDLLWISLDPDIASVVGNNTTGVATGEAVGSTTVAVRSADLISIAGRANIKVGSAAADIAFVISEGFTTLWHNFWGCSEIGIEPPPPEPTGFIETAGLIATDIATTFDDFRVAIEGIDTYDEFPWGCGWGTNFPRRDVLPFTDDYDAIADGFRSLQYQYDCSTFGTRSPETAGYNALMYTMGGNGLGTWRESDASGNPQKAIIMIANYPQNDPEPYTGYTLASVINEAKARNIQIYAINSRGLTECEPDYSYCYFDVHVAQLMALAEETGGKYYQPDFPEAYCNLNWTIDTVLQDIAANSGQ